MKLQLIHIKDYLLAVDDSNYYDEYYLNKVDMQIYKRVSGSPYPTVGGVWHKKITHHLPLNNAPVLEGVEILPPFDEAVKLSWQLDLDYNERKGFIKGYNKAKERYKFTEEDVIRIVLKCRETGLTAEYLMLSTKPNLPSVFDTETKKYIYE